MLWAAAGGVALRLLFGLGYWVGKPLTHDEHEYLSLARGLASGRGFVYDEADDVPAAERFGRAPGYPGFLALVGAGARPFDETPTRLKVAQALVGGLGVWIIGLLAFRTAGPRAGIIGAALAAVYPPLVWISAYVLSEAVYSTLALASVLWLDRALRRPDVGAAGQRRDGLAAGVLAGLATLTRPATLVFFLLAVPWLVIRRRRKLAVLLLVGGLVAIAPWTVRNVLVHGRFVLVASEGGVTFWTGNHPQARGEGDLAANPQLKQANLEFKRRHPGLAAEELEPMYYREALVHIVRHPIWWLTLLARKFFYLWIPLGPSYTLHSTRYFVATLVSYGLLLPVALAGFLRLRGRSSQPHALWLLAASAVLVMLLFFPQERFRIPVLDPTLIVAAATWFEPRARPAEASAPAAARVS